MPSAPYGTWPSPLDARAAAAASVRLSGLAIDGDDLYWIESRPAEGGRQIVVRRDAGGGVRDLTPAGLSARTRVHEYGGGAFAVRDGLVIFSHDGDGRLYRQRADDGGGPPTPLTAPGPWRYADLELDPRRQCVLAVREDHGRPGEPENAIVAIDLATGATTTVARGADFYAAPRLSPDGALLAYVTWDHPAMPWDGTRLQLARLDDRGDVSDTMQVAGGDDEAIVEPDFAPDGALLYASDRAGYWNLYRFAAGRQEGLLPMSADFGAAPWVFGLATRGCLDARRLFCAYQQTGLWRLASVAYEPASDAGRPPGRLTEIETALTDVAAVRARDGRGALIGASPAEPPAIYALDGATLRPARVCRSAPGLDPRFVSRPVPLAFASTNGATAHAHYYPPCNPDAAPDLPACAATAGALALPGGERPPLVVTCHGGPTAAAGTALNLGIQFWTTRGFAVMDVNYRGSTGFGRAYRRALDGAWGIADVDDVVAAARFAVARGLADPRRLAIRGGSAGGFTALCALAFHDVFSAGASYYGVSDLEALARDTHKFESRYLERLIGPYPGRADLYRARSPLFAADRVACPVIFFQGTEDRVVPPDQTERMAAALRARGIPVEVHLFPGEQHGFRRAENLARALDAELAFYRRIFGLEPGAALAASL